jgi:hypothetical protein
VGQAGSLPHAPCGQVFSIEEASEAKEVSNGS